MATGGKEGAAMTRSRLTWVLLTVGAALSVAGSAHAQAVGSLYSPTLSPWFGLYQKNGGPVDNYHNFVLPQLQLQDTLQRQQAAIQRNDAGLNSLDQDVTQLHDHGGVRPLGPPACS